MSGAAGMQEKLMFHKAEDLPDWLPACAVVALEGYRIIFQDLALQDGPFYHEFKCLLFDAGAEAIWRGIKDDFGEDWENESLWIATAIRCSFPGIMNRPQSPTSAKKWKDDLISALEKARDLAYETPDNYLEWVPRFNRAVTEHIRDYLPSELADQVVEVHLPHPHNIFQKAIKALEESDFSQGPYSLKPESRYADRAYFVRSLSAFFSARYSQPRRRLVADLASLAFSCDLDEGQVRRLAKDLEAKEETYMYQRVGFLVDHVLSDSYLNE